jgi:AraC-like DNA-binding protein
VERLWLHRGELSHRFEHVLPSGRIQLLVNLDEDVLCEYALDGRVAWTTSGAGFQGARSAPAIVDTRQQKAICGATFAPGGAWPFLGVPASEIRERLVDLSALWGRRGEVLREHLLEANTPNAQLDALEWALTENMQITCLRDRPVEVACAMLTEGASVRSVAHRIGLSPRRLIERFNMRTGLTPKLFARIMRFQHVLTGMDARASWADLAASGGFSDQAHLVREFRTFAATTPTAYRARSSAEPNHTLIEPGKFPSILAIQGAAH